MKDKQISVKTLPPEPKPETIRDHVYDFIARHKEVQHRDLVNGLGIYRRRIDEALVILNLKGLIKARKCECGNSKFYSVKK